MSEFSTGWLREIIAERFVGGRDGFDHWLAEVRRQAAAAGFAQGVDRTLAVTGVKTCPGGGLLTLIGNPYAAEAYRQERKEK